MTEDHSLVNELLKRGRLTPEQIAKLNMKNAVTRAVGVYETVEVDTHDFDVLAGDHFLLCSDGLSEYAQQSDILRVFRDVAPSEVAQTLVDLANAGGGKDNITAVVVKVPDTRGLDALASELNLKLETMHLMPLFRHLTYQELVHVMNNTVVRVYQHGQQIVDEGDEGDEMFIVLSGNVRVLTGDAKLSLLGPGQHFGEMALVDNAPRNASVASEGPSRLMVMRRR
ncbi:MAG: cyclic nucleotide-binding domain-containing protein, partial [Polyangiales bacterium]